MGIWKYTPTLAGVDWVGMGASVTLPREVVCTTTELTDSDTDTARVLPEELKTAGSTVNEQVLYGDIKEANTEQVLEAAPTASDTLTPAGLHWLLRISYVAGQLRVTV